MGKSVREQTDSLAALLAALRSKTVAACAVPRSVCPYRGLEQFRAEDATLFCGGDEATRELVARMEDHELVAVVGLSGSGKSSLVFAGLLLALRKLSGATMWDVAMLRPFKSLRALAEAFGLRPKTPAPAEIDAHLEKGVTFYRAGDAEPLRRIVERRLDSAPEKPDRPCVYVDQWEELYAMAAPCRG